jgi:hypothetical protein
MNAIDHLTPVEDLDSVHPKASCYFSPLFFRRHHALHFCNLSEFCQYITFSIQFKFSLIRTDVMGVASPMTSLPNTYWEDKEETSISRAIQGTLSSASGPCGKVLIRRGHGGP